MNLGEKILELRKKKGFSQEELGDRIGVTRQTISNWELGETSPNPEQLKKLSKVLNISVDELLNNDIKNVLVEKVTNTEKTTKISLIILKVLAVVILAFILLVMIKIIIKNDRESGRKIEESIHCKLYGEEHSFSIICYELTGVPTVLGGYSYFSDILDLDKYNDAHQIFNIINDYVKKNGGTCEMIKDKDLNYIVNMSIKDLSKTGVTVTITEDVDYDISYGESFWLEKYNYETHSFEKMENTTGNNCAVNLPAYGVTPDKPLELHHDFSCMYGELDRGNYRLVKNVFFESDTPVSEEDTYYIWVEFDIE